ncbi:hypothetical protein GURASL_11820 [Geotalea uraniireducens]|uniref:Tetratricopeptide repeat protein n=1 Tax=Geotalea uraniireducens TaxID=351604 RepID=A0ABN6VPL2_9BACT|nr:tetratricopeptide repeat protein [Geotalea uraniireducens]BDV42259.1 hypothetical protein GURASL_11820 [Geotalea uraniireducens]
MLRKTVRKLVLPVCLISLAGCATIVTGGPKALPIMSQPDGAKIEIIDIRNDNARVIKATTPYTASLERSAGFFRSARYKVRIAKEGYLPYETELQAELNGWYFGNIALGGALGMLIIDPGTGAMWSINEKNINVKLYADSPEGKMAMARERYNGLAPFRDGDYDQAIADLDQALTLDPEYAEGYCTRAECRLEKGEIDAALSDVDRAIALKPDYADAYATRGKLLQKKGDMASAKVDLQKAAELRRGAAKRL